MAIPFPNNTLIGSVNNVGSFDIYDLSIYASAPNRTAAQIDSVTTRTIPILNSGESTFFSVTPNPVLESKVAFYSCFLVDVRTMNMKKALLRIDKLFRTCQGLQLLITSRLSQLLEASKFL